MDCDSPDTPSSVSNPPSGFAAMKTWLIRIVSPERTELVTQFGKTQTDALMSLRDRFGESVSIELVREVHIYGRDLPVSLPSQLQSNPSTGDVLLVQEVVGDEGVNAGS